MQTMPEAAEFRMVNTGPDPSGINEPPFRVLIRGQISGRSFRSRSGDLVSMFSAKQAVEPRLEASSEKCIAARSEMQLVG